MAVVAESLSCHHQPSAGTVERIVFAAAVPDGLVLHPAPALIQRRVGEPGDVEGVGDLDRVGEHRVEHGAIRRRQIQGRPLDPGAPRLGLGSEPSARPGAVATFDDVEELPVVHVDDLGRPALPPERAFAGEQGLIEPDRGDRPEPCRVVNERGSVEHHGVHHGVPVAPEIGGDLGDRAGVATDLERRPLRCPGRQLAPARRDLGFLPGPRPSTHRATPTLLAPHQTSGPTEHRQIHQHDIANTVTMRRPPATRRPFALGGDHDPQPARPLTDPDDSDIGQADQQHAHARSIGFQAGAPRDSTT